MGGRGGPHALPDVAAFRNADALLHVVRLFQDARVPHPCGSVDPVRDVRTMDEELILADLGVVERRLHRVIQDLKKTGLKDLRQEQDVLERCRTALESGVPLRRIELEPEQVKRLRGFQLLSAKPLLIVTNLDEADLADGAAVDAAGLMSLLADLGAQRVVICAKIELEITELEHADAVAFLNDLGLRESGLTRVIQASYDLLGYISFFTIGDHECRAWSVPAGTVAQVAARAVHSDMARGFIRAEVVPYEQVMARGSVHACRDHGEVRLEGKDYSVRDGDVVSFRFAT